VTATFPVGAGDEDAFNAGAERFSNHRREAHPDPAPKNHVTAASLFQESYG
jgi:hypothetical protein